MIVPESRPQWKWPQWQLLPRNIDYLLRLVTRFLLWSFCLLDLECCKLLPLFLSSCILMRRYLDIKSIMILNLMINVIYKITESIINKGGIKKEHKKFNKSVNWIEKINNIEIIITFVSPIIIIYTDIYINSYFT